MLELNIEGLDEFGVGYGHHNEHRISVSLTIPGETVTARIFKNNAGSSEADLVDVLSPADTRVTPMCPYYHECGGCQFQHMTIESQRQWKREQVVRLVEDISDDIPDVQEIVGTEHHFGYRSKITPHYKNPLKSTNIGFQSRFSSAVVDIPKCAIATAAINDIYDAHRRFVKGRFGATTSKMGATLLFRDVCSDHGGGLVETDNRAIVTQRVRGLRFQYQAGEFFQTNPYVLPLLVEHVIDRVSEYGCSYLIDAYCGCGLFSLSASSRFKSVVGIEINQQATRLAQKNAALNGIDNASFIDGNVERIFQDVVGMNSDQAVVVIDPPRRGCTEDFLSQLFAYRPRVIVYVACNPTTQARDAKQIVEAGYRIDDITPFDMFPQTRHIENVITFSRL